MKYQDLLAYKKSHDLVMLIFEASQSFPKEEKYSLTDQIRRSSRSVAANIAESYAKRRYPKHFISKLSDADGENLETQACLKFSLDCNYIHQKNFDTFFKQSIENGRLLHFMMNNPSKFGSE